MLRQQNNTQAPSPSIPLSKPEPLTLESLIEQAKELDSFEIVLAGPDYRLEFAGLGEVRHVARVEWASRLADCDARGCEDGVVEVDRGGYTSHSTNQYFDQVECEACGGSGKRSLPVCVLVAQEVSHA